MLKNISPEAIAYLEEAVEARNSSMSMLGLCRTVSPDSAKELVFAT